VLDLTALKHLVEVTLYEVCGFLTRKKIYRSAVILNFDVLVIANQKALHRQLKDVLRAADGTGHLACRDVEILFVRDRRFLNLLHYAGFADAVSTVKNAG